MSCPQLCPVLTHLWPLLLTLGVSPKAVLLLDPPWSTTFKGKTVTLRCMGFPSSTKGNRFWQNGKLLDTVSEMISITSSGNYQCKTPGSSLSDSVHVEFSSDWLILQAPHPVYEGDDVILRCQGKEQQKIMGKNYYKNGQELRDSYNLDHITINAVSMDPDKYKCTASRKAFLRSKEETSKPLRIQVQELFPQPVLTAHPSQPIEGGPVTLTCETQLLPQKPHIQLQFCFFRDVHTLGTGCSSSPELQIPTMWTEDSGSYWCQAVTPRITKSSLKSQIHVQRIPVSNVNLEIQPTGGHLIEGQDLVLTCSVKKGTGNITFSWHRDGIRIPGRKTQRSQSAELQVPAVMERDAGRYYCTADNSDGPILSNRITVTVKIPVSNPVLTIRAPRTPAVVGDVVELRCEVLRGSPPIFYLFYHENVNLGSSSAPSGGGAVFNLSLTVEHSGKYSCEADNGLGPKRSPGISLKVIVPVSCPVFTFRSPRAQAVVGDIVELHCEAQRGSPPILYRFYHENVALGNSSAPLGGGASFNLSLNTEHAGNYSCDADNGLGAQRSEMMTLSVIGISWNRVGPVTGGVIGGLLGLVVTAGLLYHFRIQKKSGGTFAMATPSYSPNELSSTRPSTINPEVPIRCEPQAPVDLQPVYSNVNPGNGNLIYSQIQSVQHTNGNIANSPRTHQQDKGVVVIYSELKKAHPDNSAKQTSRRESVQEDDTGNYENVFCASAASDYSFLVQSGP